MTRPFTLPGDASREDCDAYVYLCERPDVWAAWCAVMREHPRACPTSAAVAVRLHGTPISSERARSFARIYRATQAQERKAA